jgi:hypothetical protein
LVGKSQHCQQNVGRHCLCQIVGRQFH